MARNDWQGWPPWVQPRRPLSQRAALGTAKGAGRLVVAGAKAAGPRRNLGEEHPRRRGLFVLTTAALAQLVAVPLHWWHRYIPAACLLAASALLPVWWRALVWPLPFGWGQRRRPWPRWRRVYLAVTSSALLLFLPVSALWLPPWHAVGAWWMPAIAPTAVAAVGLWGWLYRGHYRIRQVEEEPEVYDGPEAIWDEHIGAPGKLLPGSTLTAVREIEAPS